jgi:hypothetical protein
MWLFNFNTNRRTTRQQNSKAIIYSACVFSVFSSVYTYIPFLGIARPQHQFHIHVSVSDLYIPRSGPHIFSSRKGRPIVGIYNSVTDT